jgi:hypothetical protein
MDRRKSAERQPEGSALAFLTPHLTGGASAFAGLMPLAMLSTLVPSHLLKITELYGLAPMS